VAYAACTAVYSIRPLTYPPSPTAYMLVLQPILLVLRPVLIVQNCIMCVIEKNDGETVPLITK